VIRTRHPSRAGVLKAGDHSVHEGGKPEPKKPSQHMVCHTVLSQPPLPLSALHSRTHGPPLRTTSLRFLLGPPSRLRDGFPMSCSHIKSGATCAS